MGKKRNPPVPPGACAFCRSEVDNVLMYGKLIHKENFSVHEHCMFFSSGLKQTRPDNEDLLGFSVEDIQKELCRGQKLKCVYCKVNRATIGCSNAVCRKSFHYACGMKNHALYQHFGKFRALCNSHKPKQKKMNVPKEEFICRICFSSLVDADSNAYLNTACCKKNFHLNCIQEYAYNAGKYFFKCPTCNNKKEFTKDMLLLGIHIPIKDASWELEENAYQDLLFRPECNSTICRCEKGTKFSQEGIWTLLPCKLCGSQARHRGCANLDDEDSWTCDDCTSLASSSCHHHTSVNLPMEEQRCLEIRIETPIHPGISSTSPIANKSDEGNKNMAFTEADCVNYEKVLDDKLQPKENEPTECENASSHSKIVETLTGLESKRKFKATSSLGSLNDSLNSSNYCSNFTETINADISTTIHNELPKISLKRKKEESKETIGEVLKPNNLSHSNIFEDKICLRSHKMYQVTTSSLKPITNTLDRSNLCSTITGTTNVKLEKNSSDCELGNSKKEISSVEDDHKFLKGHILSTNSVDTKEKCNLKKLSKDTNKVSKTKLSHFKKGTSRISSGNKVSLSSKNPCCSPNSQFRCIRVLFGLPCSGMSKN